LGTSQTYKLNSLTEINKPPTYCKANVSILWNGTKKWISPYFPEIQNIFETIFWAVSAVTVFSGR
jgi:hypothetical protein